MSAGLDREIGRGREKLAGEHLRMAERILAREKPIGLREYRNKIIYVCSAGALSLCLTAWGMSLVALGRNETEDARVFCAALVVFGVLGCIASFVAAVWVGYRAFQAQYCNAALQVGEVYVVQEEMAAFVRTTLEELRNDPEIRREIEFCVAHKGEDKVAQGVLTIVEKGIREHLPDHYCPV